MLVLLVQRHPRYSIATALIILASLLFLTSHSSDYSFYSGSPPPPPPPGHPPPLYAGPGGGPGRYSAGKDLKTILAETEEAYQETLRLRQDLIVKYGPTADKVDAFPTHGEFYTLWDFFIPAFGCPHRVQRVGTLGDGGKWVCGFERILSKRKCVVYGIGVNGESSFEAAFLEKSQSCEVYGYDFSVSEWGPEIEQNAAIKPRAHFFPYRLDGTDDHEANPPMYTLRSLMEKNGHDFIDVLKVDIEGSEFPALTALLDAYKGQPLPFGQLQLEIHGWGKSFPEFLKWWERLEEAGLRPFWTEPNLVYLNLYRGSIPSLTEYSFINIKGNHAVISDDPAVFA